MSDPAPAFNRPLIHYNLADRDVARLQRGASLVASDVLAAGAERVLTGISALPMLSSHDEVDRLSGLRLRPRDFELTAYHPLGTALNGSLATKQRRRHRPTIPRCSGTLRLRDGSVIPTSPAVNPG